MRGFGFLGRKSFLFFKLNCKTFLFIQKEATIDFIVGLKRRHMNFKINCFKLYKRFHLLKIKMHQKNLSAISFQNNEFFTSFTNHISNVTGTKWACSGQH